MKDPRALHHDGTPPRGNPAAPSSEGAARSPSPGHPRRSSSEEHQGGPPRRPSPRPLLGDARRRKPWEGPPRPGSSEPRQETSRSRHTGAVTGAPARQRSLGISTDGTPPRGPPGRLLLGGSTPRPLTRDSTVASSSEEAAQEPLTGSHPVPPSSERAVRVTPTGCGPGSPSSERPPRPAPHRSPSPAGSSEPTEGETSGRNSTPLTEASPSWRFLGTSFWVSLQELMPCDLLGGRQELEPPWRATPGAAPRSHPSRHSPEQASEDRPPTGMSGKD